MLTEQFISPIFNPLLTVSVVPLRCFHVSVSTVLRVMVSCLHVVPQKNDKCGCARLVCMPVHAVSAIIPKEGASAPC